MKRAPARQQKSGHRQLERGNYLRRPAFIFRSFHSSSICCIPCIYVLHLIRLLLLVLLGDLISLFLLLCRQWKFSSDRLSLPSQCR